VVPGIIKPRQFIIVTAYRIFMLKSGKVNGEVREGGQFGNRS